jgi:ABC-type Fe3+/spermidine/putrescine transport system ATPase subunit
MSSQVKRCADAWARPAQRDYRSVTHDQEKALAMADCLAMMHAGRG